VGIKAADEVHHPRVWLRTAVLAEVGARRRLEVHGFRPVILPGRCWRHSASTPPRKASPSWPGWPVPRRWPGMCGRWRRPAGPAAPGGSRSRPQSGSAACCSRSTPAACTGRHSLRPGSTAASASTPGWLPSTSASPPPSDVRERHLDACYLLLGILLFLLGTRSLSELRIWWARQTGRGSCRYSGRRPLTVRVEGPIRIPEGFFGACS
jgi:hypothetical protein